MEQSSSQLDPSTAKPNSKHVSRACLQCRQRHMKCDGTLPRCLRCVKSDKECSYVKSNRGGSRKRGVKKSTAASTPASTPSSSIPYPGDIELTALPCSSQGGKPGPCPNGHDKSTCGYLNDGSLMSLPCTSKKDGHRSAKTPVGFEHQRSVSHQSQKMLTQPLNIQSIVHNYYTKFHNSHPILPPLDQIHDFLDATQNPKELLGVMKIIGDGYTSSVYSKNINAVFDAAMEISDHIHRSTRDVVSLQTLLLLSLVCHISALHDLSSSLRKEAIELAFTLDINNIDVDTFDGEDINGNYVKGDITHSSGSFAPASASGLTPTVSTTDEININFFNTNRVRNLSDSVLKDCARRCFWEVFFLDIIIGCADGTTLSTLAQSKCFVNFPSTPAKREFDYETRACTSKLVDEAVRLNNIIFSNMSIGQQYTKLTASLSNWELKFSNPDFYKIPYLIDENGVVNEGIQQGIIMLNYAKIFTHRPLSFLWRSDVPRNLKSVELLSNQLNKDNDNCQDLPSQKDMINSRKIIETRKTIDAANSIAKTLIDTNPVDILKRTPLNACSLAFAGLVHLSAYLWSTQISQSNENPTHHNPNDLNIYEEYMKLELSGIYQISVHFYLSSKIANYLMDSVAKLLPSLHNKISANFKHYTEDDNNASSNLSKSPIPLSSSLREDETMGQLESSGVSTSNTSTFIGTATDEAISMGMSYNMPNIQSNDGPVSPQSDTGCDWIDKNKLDFDFTNFILPEIDMDALNAIDDIMRASGHIFR